MAHIICAYSSLELHINHFPISLTNRESHHPIFDAPQKTLFAYASKWAHHELTATDSYLLFTALLKSSSRVHFRTAARYSPGPSDAVVANNMEKLLICLSRMNSISAAGEVFASIAITNESANMENAKYWIQSWLDNYEDFKENYSFAANVKKLSQRELALERMIKSPHRDVSYYASDLAKWASLAGNFPHGTTLVDGLQVPISDYWENIIVAAANKRFFTIPRTDLEECIEHCEENIDPGSIYHHKLLSVLREAKSYLAGFLGDISGLGSSKKRVPIWNFPGAPAGAEYQDTDNEQDVFAANLDVIVASAPTTIPVRGMFVNNMEYLKAKIKWSAAQDILAVRASESTSAGEQGENNVQIS